MSPAVVITGAASGIGRATALAAARAGYDLIAWDIQGDLLGELAAQVEVAITTDSFDVTDGEARRRALEAARLDHPVIAGFVHAAGVSGPEPISTFTPESWGRTIEIGRAHV